jgi:hypothetical protein
MFASKQGATVFGLPPDVCGLCTEPVRTAIRNHSRATNLTHDGGWSQPSPIWRRPHSLHLRSGSNVQRIGRLAFARPLKKDIQ